MSDLNLNNPTDFAALTSAFGSVFGNPQNQVWSIVEAKFRNVQFHVFANKPTPTPYSAAVDTVTDQGGRRKIYYEFAFQDGQTSGDLGRKAFEFDFNVLIFGPNYLAGYQAFYAALNNPLPGTLTHPVLGDFQVVADNWTQVHHFSERLAVAMRVVFKEHNFNAGLPISGATTTQSAISPPSTFKQAITAALSAFQAIDSSIATVNAVKSIATSTVAGITNQINTYKSLFLATLQAIYTTFSPDAATGNFSPDLPGVLPVSLGGAVTASGTLASNLYPLTNASQTPFANIPTASASQLATPLSPVQAQNQVNAVLAALEAIVKTLNATDPFNLYSAVLSLKQGGIQLQQALTSGIASSNATTTTYTVPIGVTMCIYEVAFAIGLDPNSANQILQLNPQLLSANLIPSGTVLTVPTVIPAAA